MPNRIIRESARTSPTLSALTAEAERLFWRLVTAADDPGRFDGDPRAVLGTCFPLLLDRIKPRKVEEWLEELASVNLVQLYEVEGRKYGVFPTWATHQRIQAKKAKFPDPPSVTVPHGDPPLARVRMHARPPRIENRESRIENRESVDSTSPNGSLALTPPTVIVFNIPTPWVEALEKCPSFRIVPRLRDPPWWQAELRANPGVDLGGELLKAQAYLLSTRRRYKDLVRFIHGWFSRAEPVEERRER